MKLPFGLEITRKRDQTTAVYNPNWWSPLFGGIQESFTGAWQQNVIIPDPKQTLLQFSAIYCCVTGIASDIAKCRIKLDQQRQGIWNEVTEADTHGNAKEIKWLSLLRKPNHYQTRIKFAEQWIVSKLLAGNTYVLKERDARGDVIKLYILDPCRVIPLVATNGEVYYQLNADYLSDVSEQVTVPASEIIHDMMVSLWHPLVGVPPIYACAAAGTLGNRIQNNSTSFFANASRPGGILTAPGKISDDTAKSLKDQFETNFTGKNSGRIAVLGDGLKFEQMFVTAENAKLVEQLEWTVQDVARAFHYPLNKMAVVMTGVQARNVEADTIAYYTDCLQSLIESMELCLDEGLELPTNLGTELDLENLWRMDTGTLFETINKATPWMKVDEQRRRAGFGPLPIGGNTVYKQHQDYSIEALAKRDAGPDPFGNSSPAPAPTTARTAEDPVSHRRTYVSEFRGKLIPA